MIMVLVILLIVITGGLAGSLCYLFALRKKTQELLKNDRMKRAFIDNVNREIQVPLKAMADLSAMISKENLYLSKNEKRNISDQMNYNTNLIGMLLDEVLMFTESDYEGQQMHMETFSPNALCRRCLEANMYSIYHREAVKLHFKRELNDEFFVKNDRHLVELILNKLILNACRFTEAGEVLVGCNTSENTNHLTIFVEDTGVGIPKNRLSRLFTWFDQPDDMNDAAELDLSICHRVAQKVGGTLYMDEHYGRKGTRFVLILPLL